MAKTPDSLPPEVLAAFERRQPIEAIRLLLRMRAHGLVAGRPSPQSTVKHNVGANKPEATSVPPVEPLATKPNGLSPGEVPRADSAFWGWVVVGLFVYLLYRLFGG